MNIFRGYTFLFREKTSFFFFYIYNKTSYMDEEFEISVKFKIWWRVILLYTVIGIMTKETDTLSRIRVYFTRRSCNAITPYTREITLYVDIIVDELLTRQSFFFTDESTTARILRINFSIIITVGTRFILPEKR